MKSGQSFSTRAPLAIPGRPRRAVLIVEDEDALRTLLTDVLELEGHAVHAFADGRAALQFLAAHPVDVIVTDLCMPEFDGFELLMKLREISVGAGVVVITGGIGREVQLYLQTARQLGATETLEKPFPLEKLLALVRGMLAKRS